MSIALQTTICEAEVGLISTLIANWPIFGMWVTFVVIAIRQGLNMRHGFDKIGKEFQIVRLEIKGEISEVRHEIKDLQKDMEQGFKDVRSEMDQRFTEVNNKIDTGLKEVRMEMKDLGKDLRSEMKEGFTEVHNKIDNGLKDIRIELKEGFAKRDHELEKTLTTLKVSRKDDPTP